MAVCAIINGNLMGRVRGIIGVTSGDGTVGKALDVLDRVASFGRPVRFSDVLDGAPYPKATLYRLLQTLTHQGVLTFDPYR